MKQLRAKVKKIEKIKKDVFLLSFSSPVLAKEANPGQFLHIKVDNETILRRPISIHSIRGNDVYLLFRVRGRGTLALSKYKKGDNLDILGPLGNGFSILSSITHRPSSNILVAGGMGVAPLVFLAERLKKQSPVTSRQSPEKNKKKNTVILGAKTKRDILAQTEFEKHGFNILIATEDGSEGVKGTVIDVLKNVLATRRLPLTAVSLYACGPNAMLENLARLIKNCSTIHCQVSFEQFMGCGIGICCGCTIKTKNGYKKACKDGPVFNIKEVY